MSQAVQFDSYGGIDVLQVREVPRPVPGVGEVLVEVKAAGINPSEAVIRSGALHHIFPATFPSGQHCYAPAAPRECANFIKQFIFRVYAERLQEE